MNKQQNNFLCEHEFSRRPIFIYLFIFFVKARFEWREVGAGFLKQNNLFFRASRPAYQMNKLSCCMKNVERRDQGSKKRKGKEAMRKE